jgi:hypothetical protein
MLNSNHHEYDIEEIARSAFPHAAAAMNFLRHHAIFRTEDGNRFGQFLDISHTPPDSKDGRQWTVLKTGPVVKTITSFDEETGLPVYASQAAQDDDLTSLGPDFEVAVTKLATKVMLRYGG